MNLTATIEALRSCAPFAKHVAFRPVSFRAGDKPMENQCHENVARWVAENPECAAVRGWLVTSGFLFDKHSLVRSADGSLFDITPLKVPTPFIEHPGDHGGFLRLGNQLNLVVHPDLS